MAEANDDVSDAFVSGVKNQFVNDARANARASGDGGSAAAADAGVAAKVTIDSPMFGAAVPLGFASDASLQSALKSVVAKKTQYQRLGIALVDLTAAAPGDPGLYAEFRGDASSSLDSIAKLAALYAAYQLRHDLKAFAEQTTPNDAAALTAGFINLLKSANASSVRAVAAKPPKFDAIFDLEQPRRIPFAEQFRHGMSGGDLSEMIQASDDRAASRCIAYLGFEWINALLEQSGLAAMSASRSPNGFYLGKLYSELKGEADPYLKNYPYHWKRQSETQFGSAKAVAQVLTLIATGRLVDSASSIDMSELLLDPRELSFFGQGLDALLGSRSPKIRSKVGYVMGPQGRASDCAIVQRQASDGSRIRYIAVGLNAAFETRNSNSVLASLIRDLDACVVARNGIKD